MINDLKQITVLASPVRISLVDTLEAIGPCSIAELAAAVGSRPDGLYYHLRILEKRGLVRRSGAIVRVVPRRIVLAYDAADKRNVRAVTRVASAILRGALRAFRAAFKGKVRTRGPRRELWAAQRTVRLSAKELATVNRLLNELVDTFGDARERQSGDRLYSITFVLSPQ
jgi:DNA-binding transcriptional ArsR family regulator